MKALKLILNFEKLREKGGYQIEKENLKDKCGNVLCEELETVTVIGYNVRGLERNFIFKAEGPRWFELPFKDVIDQILLKHLKEIAYERIEYLNNLQEYYQAIEEDDDEEYEEIINERNCLEDIISQMHKKIKVKIKNNEAHFLITDFDYHYAVKEFLSYEFENFCKKQYCLKVFIDKVLKINI